MILVTVGTQYFDELIEQVDRLAEQGRFADDVLAQIGLSGEPAHVRWIRFTDRMPELIDQADLVITHAGTGSVMQCLSQGKRFIAVVNSSKKHDHQREFVEELSRRYDFCWIGSPDELPEVLNRARVAQRCADGGIDQLAGAIRAAAMELTGGRPGHSCGSTAVQARTV